MRYSDSTGRGTDEQEIFEMQIMGEQVLDRAIELLQKRRSWVKGVLLADAGGNEIEDPYGGVYASCADGALTMAAAQLYGKNSMAATKALEQARRTVCEQIVVGRTSRRRARAFADPAKTIWKWNDRSWRTHKDVLRLLNRARKSMRSPVAA